jgi:nucleoside-diphosphate-sugar epimerase
MTMTSVAAPRTVDELVDVLSRPRPATVDALRQVPGDVVVLGAGGKMGPTLARMVARAAQAAGGARRVIAVSRFGSAEARATLERAGVEIVQADLLRRDAVARLPDAPNVIFMAGQKFGTSGDPSRTWMMNVVLPASCAERYAASRIVAFSTGNVYPLVPVRSGGATEQDEPRPVGEYAASCLGRERVFQNFANERGTRVAIVRLNYAIDLRYGVLMDVAQRILRGEHVPLAMGHVNVVWQGDANRFAIELLPHTSSPALVMNVTGPETLAVRDIARALAARLGRDVAFDGREADDALLSNTAKLRALLGEGETSLDTMLDWTAEWARAGRPLLGKPTHFETRDGAF